MSRPARRWLIALLVLLLPVVALLACEWARWPFLQQPLERYMADKLGRAVVFGKHFQLRLLGPVRVESDGLRVDGLQPADSPLLLAEPLRLNVSWRSLLDLRHPDGDAADPKPLQVRSLDVDKLEVNLQRSADGRANWHFKPLGAEQPAAAASRPIVLPNFGRLTLNNGVIRVDDAPMALQMVAKVQTHEGTQLEGAGTGPTAGRPAAGTARGAGSAGSAGVTTRANGATTATSATTPTTAASASSTTTSNAAGDAVPRGLLATAEGRWRGQPLTAELRAAGLLPLANDSADAPPVSIRLRGEVGRARLEMNGSVRDLLHFGGLDAQFKLAGPSLAAVGEPLRVTLPVTPPFDSHGRLRKNGKLWHVDLGGLAVGSSRLGGNFDFDTAPAVHRLSGKLTGERLLLLDLGPAFGTQPRAAQAAAAAAVAQKQQRLAKPPSKPPVSAPLQDAKSAPAPSGAGSGPMPAAVMRGGRVLPQREFDIPSLRAMNADVQVQLAVLDLGSDAIAPFAPLNAQLTLQDGVLSIRDLVADNSGGQLRGAISMDARKDPPHWQGDLRWSGLKLERFLKLKNPREGGQPYISGLLGGHAKLQGTGRSTARMLASLDGSTQLLVREGRISHLSMELAGIDLAESLGLLLRGDEPLQMRCAAAQLQLKDGQVTPQVAVLDTADTTVMVGGSISLADESFALVLNASPHDFSPLTLRGPVRVTGSFGAPQVKLDSKRIGLRVAAAAALGTLLSPLAAVLPMLDFGEKDREVCNQALAEMGQRSKSAAPVDKQAARRLDAPNAR